MTIGKLGYTREAYNKMGEAIEAFYSANTKAIKTGVQEAVSTFMLENSLSSHDTDTDTDDYMLYIAHRLALHLGCKIHAIIDGWTCAGAADEVNTTKTAMKNGINTMLIFCIHIYILKRFGPDTRKLALQYHRALIYGMTLISLRDLPSGDEPNISILYRALASLLLSPKNGIKALRELHNAIHANNQTSDIDGLINPNPESDHLHCPASYTRGGMELVDLLSGAFLDGMNQKFPIS